METNYKWFLVDFHATNPGSDYILAHIDTPYQFSYGDNNITMVITYNDASMEVEHEGSTC